MIYSGNEKRIQGIRSDRVPEELWTKVCDTVQEAVIKTIPRKKEMQKGKNGCLRRPYKQLRKEGKIKETEKSKYIPV